MEVLDLFSAAAGGWSLGMHRAGFKTIAACEFIDWRRALYSQNNPGVRIYDDVRTLTADQLVRDLGRLPSVVVGSPPCQDISPANTKGKGVEGARSGLYFEAIRIIGEIRPRWFSLENSANLRTRGADAVLAALEALGYSCWSYVVRAGDIGANHERPRSWLIGCDVEQLTDAAQIGRPSWPRDYQGSNAWDDGRLVGDHFEDGDAPHAHGLGRHEGRGWRWGGLDLSVSEDPRHPSRVGCGQGVPGRRAGAIAGAEQPACRDDVDTTSFGHEGRRAWGHGPNGDGSPSIASGLTGDASHADQAGQADGCMVASLRQEEIADDGRGSGRSDEGSIARQVGLCAADRLDAQGWRSDWSLDDLAGHLRLDDGLSPWLAGTRIAVGGPRGTSAASLIVEAFGDAVVPQIPEAIGKAILRTEAALAAIYGRTAA